MRFWVSLKLRSKTSYEMAKKNAEFAESADKTDEKKTKYSANSADSAFQFVRSR